MKLLRLYQDQAREHPGEAKYMLVANAIAQGVEDGCLAPGESLPTHRELAEALGVTIGTVSRGYAEAAQRGLTVGVTGRGTFVTAPCHDVDVYEGAGRMHDLGFIAPFEYLNPDLNEAVAELSRYADLKELSNYQQPRGLLRHREAGAHWAGRYGLAVSPENLLVCAGAQHALLTVLASLFNPGDRIAAGIYACGDKLPSEMELMGESGLSRSTVRHALKVLVDEGLVRTERGRGAFVADTPALHENNLVFSSYTKQVEGQGMKPTTRTVDSGFAKAMGSVAKFFDASVGSKLVKLVRLRYLDDAPLCLETTYLPPSFGSLIDRDINGSLYATLRQEFHRAPAQGHKTFEVCYASQNEAFLLNVERGQALILITDYVYDTDGRPLHVSKRIQRTDRAKYTEPIG